jgi:nitric oxide reductase NorQ protein
MSNPWSDWLDSIPVDQQKVLGEELWRRNATPRNGHNKQEESKHIPIICTPAEELLVESKTPFVDVFQLFPEYIKFAFQDHGNLLLKGPKGNGKSLSIRAFAAHHHIPLVVIECSENTKDLQLIGRYVMVGRETHFVLTGLPKAIKTANEVGRCILLLEEFNALTPQSQKLLNGVLQERAIEVDALGRTYRLNEGCAVWFTGTMNPSVYGGTYDLNEDLKSRMSEIETDYPPTELEKQIVRANLGPIDQLIESQVDLVLRFAKESRQNAMGYSLSTRDVVNTLKMIRTNGLKAALQMVICKYEGEDRKTALARLNSVFKSTTVTSTWDGKP